VFGYSLPLLFGRLFGMPLFVLGVVFLLKFRKRDEPRLVLRQALRNPAVWLVLVLTWIAFAFEIIYLANRAAPS
jgi:predicted permease